MYLSALSRQFCSIVWKKQQFRLEETSVSCWWNFYFDWKKLLFRAGGTFISTGRNFCFLLVELLFIPHETDLLTG